jgi:hypothetical protein
MTDSLTVADAVAALRARNDTHADIFEKSYAALKRPAGHVPPLIDYIRLIKDEPIEWLRTLPDSWKCLSYFLKARAAVNALISVKEVVDSMQRQDPHLLPALRSTIRTRLKSKHMDAVAKERAGLPAADPEDDQVGGDSVGEESAHEMPEACSADACSKVCGRLKHACVEYCRVANKFAVLTLLTALWDDDCADDIAVQVARLVFMDSPPIDILDAFLRKLAEA